MHGFREVEIAKSTDGLVTSQSITGRRDFADYDMLDAMIASALKKFLMHVHFRKRVSVEEQRAQKDDRFSRGRQIAYMIYELFEQPELMKLHKIYQIYSIFAYRMMTFRISIQDGTRLY